MARMERCLDSLETSYTLVMRDSERLEREIMPPKTLEQKAVKRTMQKRVAKAIAEYEKNRTNPENDGGSKGNVRDAGGVITPPSNVKTMMTIEYCSATKIQKMEQELWTLTVKGDDIEGYNNHFHELGLMYPNLVTPEKKKIECYIRGLLERVKANVTLSKPASLHDAINMAHGLIE
ncbi:hypothetical protein Tco_0678161 [Tanacetum coccineum]|uniref:Ty3 transposon capsid-like protein domain-containing protein n=1 Tax=Tanacetum coccineum TaxID=301880 RepID=A0ABQ4XFK1_9ASTR